MARDDARSEVRHLQEQSEALADEHAAGAGTYRRLHETTTVAVRLLKDDADAVMAMAASQGVPVSSLLRAWTLAGLRQESGDTVGATLTDLECGLRQLRKALG